MVYEKNILLLATQPQRFLDQINFARSISQNTNNLNIYLFVSDEVYTFYGDIVDTLEFKIINDFQKKYQKTQDKISVRNLLKNRLTPDQKQKIIKYINILKSTKLFTYKLQKDEDVYLNDLKQKYNHVSKLIKECNIDLFLVNGDRHLGFEPVFLRLAKDLKIPVIIPYMVYFAEKEGLTKSSIVTSNSSLLVSKYIKESEKRFISHKSEKKYYYPHSITNALHKFGVLTQNPWFMGSGCSDILCLPNKNMKEHYVENGIDSNKIKVIGDTSNDQLYIGYEKRKNTREKISQKYNLDNNKKIVVVALPQLGEHHILPWDKHWEEINFLIGKLENLDQNLLISLHPKMNRKKYEFLVEKYGCVILDERLADVLPIADMFVATFSSTVVWSVLCGIKTVVVDFYGLNYTMYDFLTSIKKVDKKENLETVLKNTLIEEIDFSKDWKSLSRDEVFDGQTIQRYIQLINEVSKQ